MWPIFDVSRGHLDANLLGKPILQTVLGRYDAEMQFSHMECSFGLADCLNNAQRPLQKIGGAEADFGPCRFDIGSIIRGGSDTILLPKRR